MPAVGEGEGLEPGEALSMGLGEGVFLFIGADWSSLWFEWEYFKVVRVDSLRFEVQNSRFEVLPIANDRGITGQLRRELQGPNFRAENQMR